MLSKELSCLFALVKPVCIITGPLCMYSYCPNKTHTNSCSHFHLFFSLKIQLKCYPFIKYLLVFLAWDNYLLQLSWEFGVEFIILYSKQLGGHLISPRLHVPQIWTPVSLYLYGMHTLYVYYTIIVLTITMTIISRITLADIQWVISLWGHFLRALCTSHNPVIQEPILSSFTCKKTGA